MRIRVLPRPGSALIAALLAASPLFAPPARGAASRPSVAAVRATGPIRVDGRLDEPDWERALPLRDFRLIFVREGEVPSDSTELRVLFDDRHIYFGLRCQAHGPGGVRASLAPRDQVLNDDFVALHLDTYRDFHRAYMFGVNPYGVQIDGILDGGDVSLDWDGVWDAETRRDSSGWTAEIAIPLRTLRFPRGGTGAWGLWVRRAITRHDEICSWPLWRQAEQGDIMLQAADLTGLEGLEGGGRLEVEPYLAGLTSAARSWTGTNGAVGPWSTTNDTQAGADLKYSITSTLVANATINPDYSQIEADALQIDVNRRYPLFFPEKRPFFLEGAETFSTPFNLLYTRRIANPDFGVKLVGKTGPWRLGVIGARDAGGGGTDGIGARGTGEPSRAGWFGVARATYDLGENSSVGVLLDGHATDHHEPDVLLDVLLPGALEAGSYNVVMAADAKLRLAHALFFTGQVGRASTRVDSTRAYASYYRPQHARLSDGAYDAELRWADGKRDITVQEKYLGPDFRDESGFLDQVGRHTTYLNASVITRPENAWLRSLEPILRAFTYHDAAGALEEWYVSPMVDWKLQKQTHFHTMYERVHERWLGRFYDQNHYILNLDNSLWRPLAVEFDADLGEGIYYGPSDPESFLGWTERYDWIATARPSPRLTSEITVTRSRFSREPWRGTVYDIWLAGAKTTWQFTRQLYARVYPQYDSDARHLEADGLLGYVVHPGTVLYAGTNLGVEEQAGRRRVTGRTFFLKASYLFLR